MYQIYYIYLFLAFFVCLKLENINYSNLLICSSLVSLLLVALNISYACSSYFYLSTKFLIYLNEINRVFETSPAGRAEHWTTQ